MPDQQIADNGTKKKAVFEDFKPRTKFSAEFASLMESASTADIQERRTLAKALVGETQGFTGRYSYRLRHGSYTAPVVAVLDVLAWTAGVVQVVKSIQGLRS